MTSDNKGFIESEPGKVSSKIDGASFSTWNSVSDSGSSRYRDVSDVDLNASLDRTTAALNYFHSGDPAQVKEGDEYLCQFKISPGPLPWAVCNELLTLGYPDSPFTHIFFAANTLSHKLSNDFHTLDEDTIMLVKEQIVNALVMWDNIATSNPDISSKVTD